MGPVYRSKAERNGVWDTLWGVRRFSSVLELNGEGRGTSSESRILSFTILFCRRISSFLVSCISVRSEANSYLKKGSIPPTLDFKSCDSLSSVVSRFLSCSRASSATERLISDTGFVIPATWKFISDNKRLLFQSLGLSGQTQYKKKKINKPLKCWYTSSGTSVLIAASLLLFPVEDSVDC